MHGVVPTSYGQTREAEVKSKRVLGTRKSGYAYLVPGSPEFARRWGWGRDIGNGRKKGPSWDERWNERRKINAPDRGNEVDLILLFDVLDCLGHTRGL